MTKTMKELFVAALEGRGERLVKTTGKYLVYTRKNGGHYYVGGAGGLRFGQNVANSIPVHQRIKAELLEEGLRGVT